MNDANDWWNAVTADAEPLRVSPVMPAVKPSPAKEDVELAKAVFDAVDAGAPVVGTGLPAPWDMPGASISASAGRSASRSRDASIVYSQEREIKQLKRQLSAARVEIDEWRLKPVTPDKALEAILTAIRGAGDADQVFAAAGEWLRKVTTAITEVAKQEEPE